MYKTWWQKIDYLLLIVMLILLAYGLIIVYSANGQEAGPGSEVRRQLLYIFIGIVLMVVFASIDYHFLASVELYLYIINLILLLAVLAYGKEALGAQRWISIGSFSFQPSEFAKIFIIISISARLSDENALKFEKLAVTFLYLALPMILILKQPDLGTSLVLVSIFFVMLYIRGWNPFLILGLTAMGLTISPFVLKEYQKKRLFVFVDPGMDPTGAGWNLRQSIIGVGSGKLLGKGLFSGTQTQLRFVPEHSRDFIFTVLCEELGFIGGTFLVTLYFILLFKTVQTAKYSRDLLGTLIATGIAVLFFFHVFVNIGMTMGIMPITGLPLTFMSYGGSSLISNMMAIGLLLNISMRREKFFK
ncbi:MAG: rod shape-determining protein RodA [Candidatus Eremiobacteraeota bacterium]|nr:rod shape-determining protein RodA [Candidatus Eremiobacteraeota bacterium]